ncbi:hypothetical protein IAT38_006152 [Cryptococcus sp. DSM 104549]
MAAPYQPAAGPSRSFFPAPIPNQYLPPRSTSATPSPSYSPNLDQEGWPQPHLGALPHGSSSGPGAPALGTIPMPGPRLSSTSTVGSSGSGGYSNPDENLAQKRNPLVDLMDSEKTYVEQLGLVIRRVAGAWSRKDFPPPKLDTMFRCVEGVYRANRGFGQKLKEIGPNPSSPKALGDLLMRWIDDLEPAYEKYAANFLASFDSYAPVAHNVLLPGILTDISSTSAPSPPLTHWSLDALFILPYTRLRYYRKLYARLLRSTKEGRSDHKLLIVANERLERLIQQVERRLEMDASEEDGESLRRVSHGELEGKDRERASRASSAQDSSMDSHGNRIEDRNSGGSAVTSMTQSPQRKPTVQVTVPGGADTGAGQQQAQGLRTSGSPSPVSPASPLNDLELRIDPERAIDLFSMQPKKCKLQMNPSNLPFTRSLRSSHDVTVYFTPASTGQQVIHRRAHIFVLSDLFLIAEWMEVGDKAAKAQQVAREQPERVGHGGPMPEMWLSYPPLAGKHLMVAEGQQSNVLTVMIMRKETFVVHAESEMARDQIMKDLIDCIDFASSGGRPPTAAPSPIDARSPTLGGPSDAPPFPLRYPSPFSQGSSPSTSPRPSDTPEVPPSTLGGNALVSQMNRINLEPGEAVAWPRGPSPPSQGAQAQGGQAPMATLPPRGASLRTRGLPSGPGQGSALSPIQPGQMAPLQLGQIAPMQPGQIVSPISTQAPQLPPINFQGQGQGSQPMAMPMPSGPGGPGQGGNVPPSRSPSGRSVMSGPPGQAPGQPMMMTSRMHADLPPVPQIRTGGLSGPGGAGSHLSDQGHGYAPPHALAAHHNMVARSRSLEPLRAPEPPSARFSAFPGRGGSPLNGGPGGEADDDSPPPSPVEEEAATLTGPAIISAQMKCKVFLKQNHQSWKSLGSGKLKLYAQAPPPGGGSGGGVKQLVVESDSSGKQMLISTIVLTDGVERVAKTGVAVEISDRGKRTGIVYMIQLRNENSAMGLFESLLAGSDRAVTR